MTEAKLLEKGLYGWMVGDYDSLRAVAGSLGGGKCYQNELWAYFKCEAVKIQVRSIISSIEMGGQQLYASYYSSNETK